MKKIIVLIILICNGLYGYSQSKSILFEIGGNSLLYSIGYENQFKSTDSHVSFYRVGIGVIPFDRTLITLPVELGHILGKNKHHFELSTGLTFATEDKPTRYYDLDRTITILWFNRIGYRYQKPDGRFIFRLGFTPLNARLNFWKKDGFFSFTPFGGIGFGYVFKGKSGTQEK